MARLYADEHFPVGIVYALRRLGHDVTTVRETGASRSGDKMPDELVLQYAAQQQRVVLTFNERDFRALHLFSARHFGILCCPEPDPTAFKKVARQIDRYLKVNDMNSRFEKLPPL